MLFIKRQLEDLADHVRLGRRWPDIQRRRARQAPQRTPTRPKVKTRIAAEAVGGGVLGSTDDPAALIVARFHLRGRLRRRTNDAARCLYAPASRSAAGGRRRGRRGCLSRTGGATPCGSSMCARIALPQICLRCSDRRNFEVICHIQQDQVVHRSSPSHSSRGDWCAGRPGPSSSALDGGPARVSERGGISAGRQAATRRARAAGVCRAAGPCVKRVLDRSRFPAAARRCRVASDRSMPA
jgi:hypothetical protein